ncbi:uncharacterized protein H6S33_006942 [Morchella sextelata]|uniref:uncharacterized protein n=1 Tax=Morchella sextelata TaxID=1174677 RepID=UPI001D037947|nr:uncharacterized protein H6S33_006942 [Morchella sextelata]KAH0604565.1 hypothetical protein H6S33_006942 [Morchella sextelata]
MAKFQLESKVRYHMGQDETRHTGIIKSIAQEHPVRYKVRPEGGSQSDEVLVNEANIDGVCQ